jgi:hypothetical protein
MNLQDMTMSEIEAMVAAERARRKVALLAECEAICAKHGVTLAEVLGGKGRAAGKFFRSDGTRSPRGSKKEMVLRMLREGRSAIEIAAAAGWKNGGAAYRYAAEAGIKMKDGRAALHS